MSPRKFTPVLLKAAVVAAISRKITWDAASFAIFKSAVLGPKIYGYASI
jgi:hypothetical protein